jgi:hypothetical protein
MDRFDFAQNGTAAAIMSYAKADKFYIRTEFLGFGMTRSLLEYQHGDSSLEHLVKGVRYDVFSRPVLDVTVTISRREGLYTNSLKTAVLEEYGRSGRNLQSSTEHKTVYTLET